MESSLSEQMTDNSVHIILLTARTISECNDAFWTAADAIDLLFPLPMNLPNLEVEVPWSR